MEKDLAILLDDEKSIRDGFSQLFQDLEIDMELLVCGNPKEYEDYIGNGRNRRRIKVIILDLSNTHEEATSQKYKAADYINQEYENNRIPIFIHSGNLHHYNELENKGTVIKIEKNKESINRICADIKMMKDSDFLNVFCHRGTLDQRIMEELHNAFVSQFKDTEIKNILESIFFSSEGNIEQVKLRTREIFERIAIRSVYQNWMSAKLSEDKESLIEVKLNSIEHYYRRTSDFKYWTGDVFVNKHNGDLCIICTPRCNVGHQNFDELLLCKILKIDPATKAEFSHPKKGIEALRKSITDDKRIGERFRFLPPTPLFEGGSVDYKTVFSMIIENFNDDYHYLISLSDELANDVTRKLGSYLMRGGISETDFTESLHYTNKKEE